MRIQLPFEWWLDLFDQGMQQRDQLARLSNQTSDSQFSEVMQAWLHQRSHNIKLRDLTLNSEMLCSEDGIITKRGALYRSSWNETHQDNVDLVRLPIAQVPLPPNISSFEWIEIKYLDATLFEFLQKLRRLFIDVHLQFGDDFPRMWLRNPEAMRQAALRSLPHLLPLFAVKSMHLGNHHEVFNLLLEHFPATVNGTTAIGLCNLRDIPELEPYHDNWLMNRRADGEPRLLTSFVPDGMQQLQLFRQTIQERFLASSKASTYFIRFRIRVQDGEDANAVQGETLLNNATGEQMIVSNLRQRPQNNMMAWFGINFDGLHDILFTRCPINADAAWLEQKRNWASEWKAGEKIISLQQPIECVLQNDQLPGPPPPAAEGEPDTNNGDGDSTSEQQQQPGPSSASAADQGPTTSSSN